MLVTSTPIVNLLSFILGYWAVADMYDYDFNDSELGLKVDDEKWGTSKDKDSGSGKGDESDDED